MTSAKTNEPGIARRREGLMASKTFALGERVRNFPLGLADDRWTVDGVVVELLDTSSLLVEGVDSFGDEVSFVADAAKTVGL